MKRKEACKKWIGLLLVVLMLAGSSLTAFAAPVEEKSGTFPFTVAPVNEAYLDYLENGRSGKVPSTLDLSYLSPSLAQNRARSLLPKSYDLRKLGLVGPVRDQGSYGTCWAFSALASIESELYSRFPLTDLSERHLAWFTYTGPEQEEAYAINAPIDPFQMGGWDSGAVATLAAWQGAVPESTVPYSGEGVDESLRYASDYHLQNAFYLAGGPYSQTEVTKPSLDQIKGMLMEYGALSIDYYASDEQNAYNEETFAWYNSEKKNPNHGVTVVGWDDTFSRKNFLEGNRPQKDGAWLVRNSWGENWGDGGYFWLSYEDKSIVSSCVYLVEAADNYQTNYQYDTCGWMFSTGIQEDGLTGYEANIFTAEKAEQLEAVSFYTTDADTRYEIEIYTDLADPKNPVSGKKAFAAQTGMEPFAGYHTVSLDDAVLLSEGETFSVVVKLTNTQYPYPFAVEGTILPESYGEPKYLGDGGESYLSADGVTWWDAAEKFHSEEGYDYYMTNVCIKAFTNPISTVSFSQQEGPIAFGEKVELTSPGADAVYYTTDGSDPAVNGVLYEGPIVIDREMTIRAAAKKEGTFGPVGEKSYTQAKAELTSLTILESAGNRIIDLTNGERTFTQSVTNSTETMQVLATGTGSITVNGVSVESYAHSQNIALAAGQYTDILIESEEEGKIPVTYTVRVYRSALAYDYKNETVSFDQERYTLFDAKGNPVANGSSVTPYVVDEGKPADSAWFCLVEKETGAAYTEILPTRRVAVVSPIDYENERTTLMYGTANVIATKPDMSDAVLAPNDFLSLTPGVNLYIQKFATDTAFASKVEELVVPARPAAPQNPGIDFASETTRKAVASDVLVSLTDDFAHASFGPGRPLTLIPGIDLYLRYPATDSAFASETCTLSVPDQPAAPGAPVAESATEDSISLKPVPGAEYRIDEGEWQASPLFEGLQADTEYRFEMRIAATGESFASLITETVLTTAAAAQPPADPVPETPAGPDDPGKPDTGVSAPLAAAGAVGVLALSLLLLLVLCRKRRNAGF